MEMPRRIVFSRKGFDGGTGLVPSPILSDGTMLSLPIPDRNGTVSYDELVFDGHSYGKLVTDLKAKRMAKGKVRKPLKANDLAHLDPDLLTELKCRKPGWRPIFGQTGKDATILRQHEVGVGDLFLFFGWFRRCELVGGKYHYLKGTSDIHVIFGFMRVGDVVLVSSDHVPTWAEGHPHLQGTTRKAGTRNTLFMAADTLGLPNCNGMPGAGAFTRFSPQLQLTAPEESRSIWKLPKWFYPASPEKPSLSSHEKLDRWNITEDSCLLKSVARGQEFVLDVERYPEAVGWASDIIHNGFCAIEM